MQKVLGPEHPSTLTGMNNLAGTLGQLGKFSEAEAIQRQVLELQQKVQGVEHPLTLLSMSNLASTLHQQGKFVEAETMQRQVRRYQGWCNRIHACQQCCAGIGAGAAGFMPASNAVQVLSWCNRIHACQQRCAGIGAGATGLMPASNAVQVLELVQKALGPEHPLTLTGMNNLAGTLGQLGKHAEAETMQQQVRNAIQVQSFVARTKTSTYPSYCALPIGS
eukprot:scaffold250437_cov19-Tisochrysis_lutea.AAC.1